MSRLLLINGLPGSGKSTLAQRYVADRPLALCLDVDVVRGLLGAWLDQPTQAGQLARRIAVAMAQVALSEGHDVVVPQFLARHEFIAQLETLARQLAVDFVEVVLVEDVEVAVARLALRASGPLTGVQRDAHVLLEREGGLHAVARLHDRLGRLLAGRPNARRLVPLVGDVEQTYHRLVDSL